MTRDEYEQRKQRLEQQLRSGIELLESAHRVQVRALDLVWMLQAEDAITGPALTEPVIPAPNPSPPAPAKQEPLPAANRPRRPSPSQVMDDLQAGFAGLPETFTRGDVCAMLGYEPERGGLYRILQDMVQKGRLRVLTRGEGKRATIYQKTERTDSHTQA